MDNRMTDMECGSEDEEDEDGNVSCSTDLNGLVIKDTGDEQDVSEMEESSDATSLTCIRRKSNCWSEDEFSTNLDPPCGEVPADDQDDTYVRRKSNWGSEDEYSTDLADLSSDDLFPEETENEHEVPADHQEATTSLVGDDIQCNKTIEENKKGVPSEDKLLVDFVAPSSQILVKSPNPIDPLCERTAAYVHQAGPEKKNGVQTTVLNVVNVTTDEHFSSTTSDVSSQTAPKYQLKVSFEPEEKQEENIPQIAQETHRLAILRLDLRLVRADDLFARMCCFLPEGGQIMFVAVYTTEKHGPVGVFDDEIDILASAESRQRYYGVVECDSTDTEKFVYKDFITIFSYIGVTRKMLELRFIPDSVEFDDHVLDVAAEEEKQEENIPQIAQETNRLAILGLDLLLVRADNLFARMCYFNPKGGRIMFVAAYTTEKHGPVGLFDDEIDILASVESRQRYYGVVECDSTGTAKFVYKDFITIFSYIGVTRKMLELRFIPDSIEFDDHVLDVAAEAMKFSCGTTIVGVQLKNAVGTYLAACYGSRAKYVKSLLEVGGEIASGNVFRRSSHKVAGSFQNNF